MTATLLAAALLATDGLLPAAGLRRIEVDPTVAPLRTAATGLARYLAHHGLPAPEMVAPTAAPGPGTIVVGTPLTHPALAAWAAAGRLPVQAGEDDAFALAVIDGVVAVAGANPRAALYATYELEDVLTERGGVPADLRRQGAPALRRRLLHPRVRGGFGGYREADFEGIARAGGNVAHLTHDWMAEKTLFSFVPCPEFPRAVDPAKLEANRAHLRRYLAWCEAYGLEAALWLCELPCQGGPWVPEVQRQAFLSRFPAECLADSGTYQGQVLCLAQPLVKQAYAGMVRRLLTDFPQLAMVLVFTLDSSGELCDPARCPRHHGVSKLAQYDELLALLATEGRAVRPTFETYAVGWGWQLRGDPEFLTRQAALPAGAGLATLPDAEAWSFDRKLTDELLHARAVTGEQGQPLLGYDILLWGDDTVFPQTELYDFPLGVAAKLRRWQALGADGVFDQWGTRAEYGQANAAALRQFSLHPETTAPAAAREYAARLADRRFGPAGPQVLAAWEAIEAAQQLQSDHAWYWHHLRPNWAGPTLNCPLTVEALQAVRLVGAEPPKPCAGVDPAPHRDDLSRARVLGPALTAAADHFARAARSLEAGLAALPDGPSPWAPWWAPEPLPARELLRKELTAVQLQEQTQRRMGRFFTAYALVRDMPATGPGRAEALATLARLRAEAP